MTTTTDTDPTSTDGLVSGPSGTKVLETRFQAAKESPKWTRLEAA